MEAANNMQVVVVVASVVGLRINQSTQKRCDDVFL